MRITARLSIALAVTAALGAAATGRAQEAVQVPLDFAEIIQLDQPASTLVVGAPGLVTATLSDSRTMVLHAKRSGTTNVIVLGDDGREVGNYLVSISPTSRTITSVYHGTARQTFACKETCSAVLSVGDEHVPFFQPTELQVQDRAEAASGEQ